ncbi:hypothetical protein F5148DRAFT_1238163 [Russula earlei]|uniref:Uncharacterized protein n=1 Tax=Russula earlei TaxID=71964 RepID=A0ACC0TXR8_9AGAM|nr:hypothetical protein F5148DRAFT_1238163 [Russula earlei]
MLPFALRCAILRGGIFTIAPKLPTPVLLFNRNLTTAPSHGNSPSTADSEPGHEPKSKPKSTRRKTGSSTEAAGKVRAKKVKSSAKTTVEPKVVIKPEDFPPKGPANVFGLWLHEWTRTQPKIDSRNAAQNHVKKGAEIWGTVSEYDKQRYREKYDYLHAEYKRRLEEWREQVDPAVLRELNRRRRAKGQPRIRGPATGRPLTAFIRFYLNMRDEHPRTEGDVRSYVKALSGRWRALSDAEKARYKEPARAELTAWIEKRKVQNQAKQ